MNTDEEAPPPSYAQATGSSQTSSNNLHPNSAAGNGRSERNGIPIGARRSMEDERRPLPKGWVRSYDPNHKHQFFVDTTKDPPTSIWHHPYDDDQYLSTLTSEERERIQAESMRMREAYDDSTDEEKSEKKGAGSGKSRPIPQPGPAPPMPSNADAAQAGPSNMGNQQQHTFGRRLKDRLTNTTHEEREESRRQRAQQEEQAYRLHLQFRNALSRAIQTGQPQFVCTGPRGRDIYVEPPYGAARAPPGSHGVNPYSQGPYANPNARFIRPEQVYGRRPGGGFGGGMGVPLAAGGIAGAAGGLLLGGLLF